MARVTQPETFTAGHHAAIEHTSVMIKDLEIVNADIAAAAAIEYAKLALTGLIRDADVKSNAAIAQSKLSLTTAMRLTFFHKRPLYPATTTTSLTYVAYGDTIYVPRSHYGLSNAEVTFGRSGLCDVREYDVGYSAQIEEWLHTGSTQTMYATFTPPYTTGHYRLEFKSDDGSSVELQGGVLLLW